MDTLWKPDKDFEQRMASRMLDVLIRAALVFALALLCYRVFSPFLTLMVWALILAVTLYPLHRALAARIGGRQGLAAALLVLACIALIVLPTAVLTGSLGDSVYRFVNDAQSNSLEIPAPVPGVEAWPVIGGTLHGVWAQAHADLPALVRSMQPQLGELAKSALETVGNIGGGLLQFLASFIIAGIIMAFGQPGGRAMQAIFERVAGSERGGQFAALSAATIRAVAAGVIGVAFVQAIIIGLALLVVGIPWAGVLAAIVFVMGIAQLPALIVTLPAIGYLWWSGDHSNAAAIAYTALLLLSGMADNVLKPLMLGRGVDAPMPVVLFGALGGMAAAGILGMFVGATLLALGYRILMIWVDATQEADSPQGGPE